MERERRNPTLWIILGIVLVLACCCVLAVAAATFLLAADRQVDVGAPDLGFGRVTDTMERSFNVGSQPTLEVDNFAGAVTIRAGEPGVIRVVATRRAPGRGDLDSMTIDWEQTENGLRIVTQVPARRFTNRSVDLDIEVPADARVTVDSGAGEVHVDGVAGELDLHTGAGDVRATGPTVGARIETGAGAIRYDGDPGGDVYLQTGAGSITILLPSGAGADLDLNTGVGSVDVDNFEVVGDVSPRDVRGTIGGGGPTIEAHTGAGSIDVRAAR